MGYRCFLFDHDDTLLPTFALRARVLSAAAQAVLGAPLDGAAALAAAHGRNLEQMSSDIVGGDAVLAASLVSAYRERYYEANREGLAPYDGIPETLAGLRARGHRVAVVTSKLGRGAREELQRTGLAEHVEFLVGSEDVTRPKPDAEPLRRAMTALDATPAETLMVGDTRADILGARAAGTASAVALWGSRESQALGALGPTHTLHDPRAILALAA
jgi:pyrophosphatase PpaX